MRNNKWICPAILIVLWLIFFGYNVLNNKDFWDASFVNCVTIGTAVGVSYWLTQKKTDRRKQKDLVVDLVLKIQLQISHENMYCLSGKATEEITLRNRDLNNKLHILQRLAAKKFHIEPELAFILNAFSEYEEFVGDHIDDAAYLAQSKKELQRPLGLIDAKLSEVAIKLYG